MPGPLEPNSITANAGDSLLVLIVEDYPDCATSTGLLLRAYGHRVQIATNGEAALESARQQCPDVALLDIGLPGMDGWELAKQLRIAAKGKRLWLIAVTGYGRETDCIQSTKSGIDVHLTKPVEPLILQELLERIARERCANHEGTPVATDGDGAPANR